MTPPFPKWPGLGFPMYTTQYQWIMLYNPPAAANDEKEKK